MDKHTENNTYFHHEGFDLIGHTSFVAEFGLVGEWTDEEITRSEAIMAGLDDEEIEFVPVEGM